MSEIEEKILILYEIYGVDNDYELSKKLGYKSKSNISNWKTLNTIPAKIERIISKHMNSKQSELNNNEFNYENSIYNFDSEIQLEPIKVKIYQSLINDSKLSIDEKEKFRTIFHKHILKELFHVKNYEDLYMITINTKNYEPIVNLGENIMLEKGAVPENGDIVLAKINNLIYIKYFEKEPFGAWIKLSNKNIANSEILLDTQEKISQLKIIGIVRKTS